MNLMSRWIVFREVSKCSANRVELGKRPRLTSSWILTIRSRGRLVLPERETVAGAAGGLIR